MAGQVVAAHEGASWSKMAIGQAEVGTVAQQGQHRGQQEHRALVIAARGRVWSSHSVGRQSVRNQSGQGKSCLMLSLLLACCFWKKKGMDRDQRVGLTLKDSDWMLAAAASA